MAQRATLLVMLALAATGAVAVTGCASQQATVRRYGQVLEVKPEKIEEYKRLHADVWPGVLKQIKDCNIRGRCVITPTPPRL